MSPFVLAIEPITLWKTTMYQYHLSVEVRNCQGGGIVEGVEEFSGGGGIFGGEEEFSGGGRIFEGVEEFSKGGEEFSGAGVAPLAPK